MDDRIVNVVARLEGILLRLAICETFLAYMRYSKEWHLDADHRIDDREDHVLRVGIRSDCGQLDASTQKLTMLDSARGHEEADKHSLPE